MKKITFLVSDKGYEELVNLQNQIYHDQKRIELLIDNIAKISTKSTNHLAFYNKRIDRNILLYRNAHSCYLSLNSGLVEDID